MADKFDLGTSDFFKRQAEIGGLMLRGAAYGAVLFIAVGLFIGVFRLIGSWLPEESKEAPDPTPWSLMAPEHDVPAEADGQSRA